MPTYDAAWLAESRRRVYNGTPAEQQAVIAATEAVKVRAHRLWHQTRGLPVCAALLCRHAENGAER